MSILIEFIVPDLSKVVGLDPQFATWGEERVLMDPPRYSFASLAFSLTPIALHVRAGLPPPLANLPQCLELDEDTVLQWSRGALDPAHRESMRRFIESVSVAVDEWAAVCDPDGGPAVWRQVQTPSLFDCLEEAVKGERQVAMGFLLWQMPR